MRFLSCMNSLMNYKIIFVSEAFVTFTTFIRFSPCMNSLMNIKIIFLGKHLSHSLQPAQANIPSQTLNYHRWRNQSIPRQNQIHTLSFQESSLQRIITEKKNTRTETTSQKKQESNPSTNQNENSHKNRMPTLTTKIKGSNNYFSLISLFFQFFF